MSGANRKDEGILHTVAIGEFPRRDELSDRNDPPLGLRKSDSKDKENLSLRINAPKLAGEP